MLHKLVVYFEFQDNVEKSSWYNVWKISEAVYDEVQIVSKGCFVAIQMMCSRAYFFQL